MLDERERELVEGDVRSLVESHGVDAVVKRPRTEVGFSGAEITEFDEVGTMRIEVVPSKPDKPYFDGCDARAHAPSDADIQPDDRLEIGDDTYRVLSVRDQSLFGTLTHKTLELEIQNDAQD